jgi:hypothetical protein
MFPFLKHQKEKKSAGPLPPHLRVNRKYVSPIGEKVDDEQDWEKDENEESIDRGGPLIDALERGDNQKVMELTGPKHSDTKKKHVSVHLKIRV